MNIIIIIVLLLILYLINSSKIKELYENYKMKSLVQPNYVPNTRQINYKNNEILSFNIDKQCKNPVLKKYLGWKCFARNFQKCKFNEKKHWEGTCFSNYMKNHKLKYDGIWDTKCTDLSCKWD